VLLSTRPTIGLRKILASLANIQCGTSELVEVYRCHGSEIPDVARLPVSVSPSTFVPFGYLGCGSSAQGAPDTMVGGRRVVAGVTMPDGDERLKMGL
jgi:hypothetical protein